MRHTLFAVSSLAALSGGCFEEPVAEPEPGAVFAIPPPGRETQGRYLLGEALDAIDDGSGAHVSASISGLAYLTGADLIDVATGAPITTMTFPRSDGGEIEATRTVDSTSGNVQYAIQTRDAGAVEWTDPCEGGPALVFSGVFLRDGLHVESTGSVSFACLDDGVGAKCIDWGYEPGTVRASVDWQIHQACTRMARADYCSNGITHTREGTTIVLWDEQVIRPEPPPGAVLATATTWAPPVGDFYFEGVWQGESEPVMCLSKLRWQGLPPGGLCPATLPDPRLDPTALYCEDYGGDFGNDALVFSASPYSDLGFHLWKNGADVVGTVDGFHSDDAADEVAPYNGYQWLAIDSVMLRVLPESIKVDEVVDVHLYRNGTNTIYAPVTAPLGAAWTDHGWRGMVYDYARDGAVPWKLYRNPTTGDLVTAASALPATYTDLGTVGWVDPVYVE